MKRNWAGVFCCTKGLQETSFSEGWAGQAKKRGDGAYRDIHKINAMSFSCSGDTHGGGVYTGEPPKGLVGVAQEGHMKTHKLQQIINEATIPKELQ